MTSDTKTIERILILAAMLGTVVSVFTAGAWFGLWLGSPYLGFALAVVVDVGMLAAILASRKDKAALWIVGMLAAVSWAANAQHALLIHNGGKVAGTAEWMALDVVTLLNALVVTAIAPVAALALAMLYHRSAARSVDIPGGSVITVGVTPSVDAPVYVNGIGTITNSPGAPSPVKAQVPTPKPARVAPRPAGAKPADPAVLAAKATVQATGKLPDGFSTQSALARHLGIDPARVSEWKREIANGAGQAVAQ